MGCRHDPQGDMLSMAFFCMGINDALVDFLCEDKDDKNLEEKTGNAVKFLDQWPERKGKRGDTGMPRYESGRQEKRLSYEQIVATKIYLDENKKAFLETKKKLRVILNRKVSVEKRKAAAEFCFSKFLSGMHQHFNFLFEFPEQIPQPDYAAIFSRLTK